MSTVNHMNENEQMKLFITIWFEYQDGRFCIFCDSNISLQFSFKHFVDKISFTSYSFFDESYSLLITKQTSSWRGQCLAIDVIHYNCHILFANYESQFFISMWSVVEIEGYWKTFIALSSVKEIYTLWNENT